MVKSAAPAARQSVGAHRRCDRLAHDERAEFCDNVRPSRGDLLPVRGAADIAEQFGGGYADVTTRADLRIRETPARRATDVPGSYTATSATPGAIPTC
ncbi:MAG: hypothetical protein JNL96_25150 [Planctomycetaceae bacterium]|nr:hypothetical protein [Planctomycetaceae bacterium]